MTISAPCCFSTKRSSVKISLARRPRSRHDCQGAAALDAAVGRGLDEAALIHEWVKEKLGHR